MSGHLQQRGLKPFGAELQTVSTLPAWARGPAFPLVRRIKKEDDLHYDPLSPTQRKKSHHYFDSQCYHASADPRAITLLQETHHLMDFRSQCVWCGNEDRFVCNTAEGSSSSLKNDLKTEYQKSKKHAALLEGPRLCPTCLQLVAQKAEDCRNSEDLTRYLTSQPNIFKPTLSLIFLAALTDRALFSLSIDHDKLKMEKQSGQSIPSSEFKPIRRNRKRGRVYNIAKNEYSKCTVFAARGHPDLLYYDDLQRTYTTSMQNNEYIEPEPEWLLRTERQEHLQASKLYQIDIEFPLQVGDFVEYTPVVTASANNSAKIAQAGAAANNSTSDQPQPPNSPSKKNQFAVSAEDQVLQNSSMATTTHFAELVSIAHPRKHLAIRLCPLKGFMVESERECKYLRVTKEELKPAKCFVGKLNDWSLFRPKTLIGYMLAHSMNFSLHVTPKDLVSVELDQLYETRLQLTDNSGSFASKGKAEARARRNFDLKIATSVRDLKQRNAAPVGRVHEGAQHGTSSTASPQSTATGSGSGGPSGSASATSSTSSIPSPSMSTVPSRRANAPGEQIKSKYAIRGKMGVPGQGQQQQHQQGQNNSSFLYRDATTSMLKTDRPEALNEELKTYDADAPDVLAGYYGNNSNFKAEAAAARAKRKMTEKEKRRQADNAKLPPGVEPDNLTREQKKGTIRGIFKQSVAPSGNPMSRDTADQDERYQSMRNETLAGSSLHRDFCWTQIRPKLNCELPESLRQLIKLHKIVDEKCRVKKEDELDMDFANYLYADRRARQKAQREKREIDEMNANLSSSGHGGLQFEGDKVRFNPNYFASGMDLGYRTASSSSGQQNTTRETKEYQYKYVIFLDVDGVLNTYPLPPLYTSSAVLLPDYREHLHYEKVKLLGQMITKVEEAALEQNKKKVETASSRQMNRQKKWVKEIENYFVKQNVKTAVRTTGNKRSKNGREDEATSRGKMQKRAETTSPNRRRRQSSDAELSNFSEDSESSPLKHNDPLSNQARKLLQKAKQQLILKTCEEFLLHLRIDSAQDQQKLLQLLLSDEILTVEEAEREEQDLELLKEFSTVTSLEQKREQLLESGFDEESLPKFLQNLDTLPLQERTEEIVEIDEEKLEVEVEIVLSTAWRHSQHRVQCLRDFFFETNQFELNWIGSTDRLEDDLNPATARCFEIRAFAESSFVENKTRWICMDDLELHIAQKDLLNNSEQLGGESGNDLLLMPIETERMVCTKSGVGLTTEKAEKAVKMLLEQDAWVLAEE
ncbi:unnamed protein product [Amoebophrya sp. A120]|nr:unnamed protein product [Amoebophrya sp. A120]|eukprot:GSA120T00013304001.1